MKKAVTLVLVLSMVSMASAALAPILTYTDTDAVNGGACVWTLDLLDGSVTGTGSATSAGAQVIYSGYFTQADLIPSTAVTSAAAGDAGQQQDPYAGNPTFGGLYWNTIAESTGIGDAVTPGTWFEFDLVQGTDAGKIGDVTLTNLTGEVLLQGTVPEPATMALLGLGALLLRRKK